MTRVLFVTATYRRPAMLSRLLASLRSEAALLGGVIVVDNGGDVDPSMGRAGGLSVQVIKPGRNLGCGGGVALGLRHALADDSATHLWIMDDDAVASPGALATLVAALDAAGAAAAVPLITDYAGRINWHPGPLDQPAWDAIRGGLAPAEFRSRLGSEPRRWTWAPWTSLLVTRRIVETIGLPRDDFWFQGEDIEWTLRISAQDAGVLVPAAECRHLPPPASSDPVRRMTAENLKALAMLQNNAFTATRLPHGRRILRHMLGNGWRYLRGHRFGVTAWSDLMRAHWLGAARGLPAGRGVTWQQRWVKSGLE